MLEQLSEQIAALTAKVEAKGRWERLLAISQTAIVALTAVASGVWIAGTYVMDKYEKSTSEPKVEIHTTCTDLGIRGSLRFVRATFTVDNKGANCADIINSAYTVRAVSQASRKR
jgi:hypothetical protein